VKQTWSERLKQVREDKALSGEAFVKLMRYSKAQISKLESGLQQEPSDDFLDALERIHQVNRAWLTHGTGPMYVSEKTSSEPGVTHLNDAIPPYRAAASPQAELLRTLEAACSAAIVAGRTDLSRAILDLIDTVQPAANSQAIGTHGDRLVKKSPPS